MIDKNLVESITITNDKSKKVDIQAQDITEALSNSAQSQTQSDLNEKGRTVTPFLTVVEELTTKRNSFAKKTYYNLLYKYLSCRASECYLLFPHHLCAILPQVMSPAL